MSSCQGQNESSRESSPSTVGRPASVEPKTSETVESSIQTQSKDPKDTTTDEEETSSSESNDEGPHRLTKVLRNMSYHIHCKLHGILAASPIRTHGEYIREDIQLLLDHEYINDLNMPANQLRQRWAILEPAMEKCLNEDMRRHDVEELLNAVIEIGGDKIEMTFRVMTDGAGKLRVPSSQHSG